MAVCDVKADRREAVKKMADAQVRQPGLRHVPRLARVAGPRRYRRGADRHRPELARDGLDPGGQRRQGRVLREALHEEHRAEPGAGRDVPPHRAACSRPARSGAACRNFMFAIELARTGKLGKLQTLHAHPMGLATVIERLAAGRTRAGQRRGRLGPVPRARRPGGRSTAGSSTASTSRKAAALVGGGVPGMGLALRGPLPVGQRRRRHGPGRIRAAEDNQLHARYANGVKLVMRNDGWLPLGSCPVRFEGETGWVETGDNGELVASSPALLVGKRRQDRRLPGRLPRPRLPRLREDAGPDRGPTPTWPATRTSPATRPTSRCSWTARSTSIPGRTSSSATRKPIGLRSEALREPWRL